MLQLVQRRGRPPGEASRSLRLWVAAKYSRRRVKEPVTGQVDRQQIPCPGRPGDPRRPAGSDRSARSIAVMTAKPPMPGSDRPAPGGRRAGPEPRWRRPGSVYIVVATTRASRAPGTKSAAGTMAGQVDDLGLLLQVTPVTFSTSPPMLTSTVRPVREAYARRRRPRRASRPGPEPGSRPAGHRPVDPLRPLGRCLGGKRDNRGRIPASDRHAALRSGPSCSSSSLSADGSACGVSPSTSPRRPPTSPDPDVVPPPAQITRLPRRHLDPRASACRENDRYPYMTVRRRALPGLARKAIRWRRPRTCSVAN